MKAGWRDPSLSLSLFTMAAVKNKILLVVGHECGRRLLCVVAHFIYDFRTWAFEYGSFSCADSFFLLRLSVDMFVRYRTRRVDHVKKNLNTVSAVNSWTEMY